MRRPGTWIAALALFVALGGTAVAAKHYLITSTHQIKPSVLRALRGNAGPKGVRGPQGAPGTPGASGTQGLAGPSNLSPLTTVLHGGEASAGQIAQVTAFCPTGSHAVSGGGESGSARLEVSEMASGNEGWFLIVDNESATTVPIHAEAYCATAGRAVAASRGKSLARTANEKRIAGLVAKLIAERKASRH